MRTSLRELTMANLPILCYHNIGQSPKHGRFPLLYVSQASFERQLRTIRLFGMRGVSIGEGLRKLGGAGKNDLVALTFDDGYADTLIQALPLLLKYGFTATCYLVSDTIGKHNLWDAEFIQEKKALMDHDQVRQWLDAGMEIGSHSRSHPKLQDLADADAWPEILESKSSLCAAYGVSIEHFCYPFGRFADRTAALVKRAGYVSAVSLQRGIARAGDDHYRLPRVFVNGEHGWWKFLLQLVTPYENCRRPTS